MNVHNIYNYYNYTIKTCGKEYLVMFTWNTIQHADYDHLCH